MNKIPMTKEGYLKLQDELKKLTSEDRPNIIAAIAEARGHGDLSENDIFGINMTVPQFSIPMDCEDPLLLIKQHHRKSSLS